LRLGYARADNEGKKLWWMLMILPENLRTRRAVFAGSGQHNASFRLDGEAILLDSGKSVSVVESYEGVVGHIVKRHLGPL